MGSTECPMFESKTFPAGVGLHQCSVCTLSPESARSWGSPARGETDFFVFPSATRTGRRLLLLTGNTWVSAAGTSLQLSLAFDLLFPSAVGIYCSSLLGWETGEGDGGGATWGERVGREWQPPVSPGGDPGWRMPACCQVQGQACFKQ